jgi:phenol 2-monooxygenase
MQRFQKQFIENLEFTGGLAVHYEPSDIVAELKHQNLAAGEIIGKRFHSAPVLRLADAKPMHLGHVAEADGRWRLYAFAGQDDTGNEGGAIDRLCSWLETDTRSPLRRFTRENASIDALFDLRAIFQQDFRSLNYEEMPSLLRPAKGRFGLRDFEKVFCVDHKLGDDIYSMRGIDRKGGCLIVVRPDQYIAQILPLDGFDELSRFFDAIFTRQDNA